MSKLRRKKRDQALTFFDIDGTLADFVGHAKREGKINPDGTLKYDEMDAKWWATMPPYKGARELYDAAAKLGKTKFLTGPVLNPASFEGKAQWVEDFVPERGREILEDLIICRSDDKYLLAGRNRILVDDRASNIAQWQAAGGIGILYTGDPAKTLREIQEAVAKINTPRYKKILCAIFKRKASKAKGQAPAAARRLPKLG